MKYLDAHCVRLSHPCTGFWKLKYMRICRDYKISEL